jgi:broad specificity phosphatase PhoE
MLEMEREVSDLIIIAHESVLRVLCAYFMENSADVSPLLRRADE